MATPEQEGNLQRARFGLEAWMSGDVETTLAQFTDDVEVYVPTDLGNAGTFQGQAEFTEWTRQWYDAWSEFNSEVVKMEPVGERHVVVTVHNTGRGRGSGIEVENVQGWVLGIRAGVDLCEFISLQATPEQAMELARSREAA